MILNHRFLLISAAALAAAAAAYARHDAGFMQSGDGWTLNTAGKTITVTPVTNDIFRVATLPDTSSLKFRKSQSAVLSPRKAEVRTATTPEAFFISSPTTTVRVDRADGKVSFHNASGDLILSETGGIDNAKARKTVSFQGDASEGLYGAGERGHRLNLNGDTLVMYNRQNYGYVKGDPRISQMGVTVPWFASDLGYGVLFDDYNDALLVLGDTIEYSSETPWPLAYYFVNGNGSLAGTTSGYTLLTGRQDLPPFWALGYVTSKYGYHNQKEAEGAVDSLKTRGYPLDGMVLDLYWYGVETDMGRLEWDPKQWPDHKGMLRRLKEKGVNTVLINQPYINKIGAIDNYNAFSKKGMLAKDSLGNTHDLTTWVGDAGLLDMSNPLTREWLWNRLKGLTEEGVAGWWGDLGDLEVHPLTMVHDNGETAAQYHNVYGNEWSRLIYEGLRKDFPDMRPLLLMRGGTAGLQRYSVFPWTTDVSRSWGGFQPQVNLMVGSGLSGLAYMGSDIGGFAVDPEHPTDPELYVRWVQMGTFSPMLRTHAQTKPEPYHYPEYEDILKKFIRMRYEWLPYNYTLAYENASKGWPLARPLNFDGNPDNEALTDIQDEYMWGSEVLVAPVLEPGVKTRKVVFPAGEWVNFNNPSLRYKGNTEAVVQTPIDQLPLFVRAGAFIPLYPGQIGNTGEYNPQFLTVRYYPSTVPSEYTLFDDDRKSPTSLEDGQYQLTYFSGVRKGKEIEISLKTNGGSYEGMPALRMVDFEIPDVARPRTVSLSDGVALEESPSPKAIRQYGWAYDSDTRTLTVRFPWTYSPLTVTVK